MKTSNHLYKVLLGFYGYDEVRERYVIAADVPAVKEYVEERWSLSTISGIEYIDVINGKMFDTPERAEVIEQINELRGIHEA